MNIQFLGAAGTVTGSKYLVESKAKRRVLVDCGLFQGWKQLRLRNWEPFPVPVASIHAIVLTHAHIDHSGYLPCLWKQGYRGPIFCTKGTKDLCELLLPDAGHLQEEDADYANRKGFSKHTPALPLFTEEDARNVLTLFREVDFDQEVPIAEEFSARWQPAGHIVGAASVLIKADGKTLLFSGDLGRMNDLIMLPPAPPPAADFVVVESTYGSRLHPADDFVAQLGEAIRRTFNRKGIVILPAFSVGRTQSVLYALYLLKQKGKLREAPIYLNSPLSINATGIYNGHRSEHRLTEEECRAMCGMVQYIHTVEESKRLNTKHGPMIILSASGMATGGRVLHHIEQFGPDARNTILFTGYQAGGTRGADLIHGVKALKMHGKMVPINAEVVLLEGMSAHADQAEILNWLKQLPKAPKALFVTHGEPEGASGLQLAIREKLDWKAEIPHYLQTVDLN